MASSLYRSELTLHYEHVGTQTRHGWVYDDGGSTALVHPFDSRADRDRFLKKVEELLASERFDHDADRVKVSRELGEDYSGDSPRVTSDDVERAAAYLSLTIWGGSESDREKGQALLDDRFGSESLLALGEQWWNLGEKPVTETVYQVLDVNQEAVGIAYESEAEAERYADRFAGNHVIPVERVRRSPFREFPGPSPRPVQEGQRASAFEAPENAGLDGTSDAFGFYGDVRQSFELAMRTGGVPADVLLCHDDGGRLRGQPLR